MRILLLWLLNAVALLAVAYLLPSIQVASFGWALAAALILGLINSVVRPVLALLTLPITLLTLGLIVAVRNRNRRQRLRQINQPAEATWSVPDETTNTD